MDSVSRYLHGGLEGVEGWLHPISAAIIASVGSYQTERGWTGSVGEVGVHHGKLFLILHLLASSEERSFAVDLFENQHLNSDLSGKGDYAQFMRNIAKWGGRAERVEIFKGSSLDLDPQAIIAACGQSRLFSVDGGHTEECTRNDLEIAEAVSHPYGVVVIDDVFNEFFPEVSMGLHAYSARGRLKPFAIAPNKLFLADPAYASAYREQLRMRWANRFEKTCSMFGSEVDLFGIRYASYPAWKKVLQSPLYPNLKKLKATLEHNP